MQGAPAMKLSFTTDHNRTRLYILGAALVFAVFELVRGLVHANSSNHSSDAMEAYQETSAPLLLAIASNDAAVFGLGLLGCLAILSFVFRQKPIISAGLTLIVLILLSEAHRIFWGGPSRAMYVQGAVLFAWLMTYLGFAAAKHADRPDRLVEDYAHWAGLGMLAGYYCSAGLSKLITSGASWMDPGNLQSIVVVHSAYSPDMHYAQWFISHPWIGQAFALATVILEVFAFAMLLGVRWRQFWAVGLLLMHVNIGLLTGTIWYLSPMALLVGYTLPMNTLNPNAKMMVPVSGVIKSCCVIGLITAGLVWMTPMGDEPSADIFLEQPIHHSVQLQKSVGAIGNLDVEMDLGDGGTIQRLLVGETELTIEVQNAAGSEVVFSLLSKPKEPFRAPFEMPTSLSATGFY